MNGLTNKKLDDILKYQPLGGKTINDWFANIAAQDITRINTAITAGMNEESLSIPQVIKNVFGEGGAVNATRKQVKMAARTLTIAIANHSKFESYKEIIQDGSGDITAVEWSAFFDSRVCPVCAIMNGKRWDGKHINDAKIPPLHPNCRCSLLPYNDESDEDENGIGLSENFDALAKEEYEKKYPEKKWDDLAESTRTSKMYEYRRDWEKRTGKDAYISLESASFDDYLKSRSEEFQREWLGATRYNLWKEGKLKSDDLVNPDSGYRRSIKELEESLKKPISPAEMTTKQFFDFSDKNADNYTEKEQETSRWYSEPKNASDINTLLRGETSESDKTQDDFKEQIETLDAAITKYALPEDTILFRGCREVKWLFGRKIPHVGQERTWRGFTSATIGKYIGERYSHFTEDSVVIELHAPKGTNGIPMGTSKLSTVHKQDKEFLLKQNTIVKVISVEKKTNGWYVVAEIEPE